VFDKKYQTRGVAAEVNLDIQLILWSMIDTWKAQKKELDYLQVFELSIERINGKPIQKVVHRQEVPPRKEEMMFRVVEPMNGRLWVVDGGEGAVMMKPDEY